MSEDQEISSFLIDSYVLESNSNAPNSNQVLTTTAQNLTIFGESNSRLPNSSEDLIIIAQNPIILDGSNSNSLNSDKGSTIIVQNPIILDGSNSNSNSLNYNQASTIEAQNVTIITPESRSIIPQLSMDFGIDPRYATIFAKQTHIGNNQNFSCGILSLNHPEFNDTIGKFINEVAIDAFKRLKNKPDRSDGIPDDVLDYLGSKGIKNRKSIISNDNNNRSSAKKIDSKVKETELVAISVDTKDIPLDKVDVVYGDNYTTLNVKKGFGISKLTDGEKTIWKSNESSKCAKQVLLYNNCDKSYAFLLLNDMELVSLERTGWFKTWKRRTKMFDINHLDAIKYNHYNDPVFEFLTEFVGHFLIIFMPCLSNEITYKESIVFKDNDDGNYPLFLSVDLLTGQIKPHLYHIEVNHNVAEFQLGHELSDLEKRGEEDIPVLDNIRELISSIHDSKEMDGGNGPEKLTNELTNGYTNSPTTNHSNSDGSTSPENQQKFESESANNCDPKEQLIKHVELDIYKWRSEYYSGKFKSNSRYYRANENVLFDKVIDGKKVIWKMKKNELLAKEVYFYFDENDKWVIILLDNNTLKFYHKPSDSEEWTDVSTKMLSTDILKVINKNSGKLSRMDLNFDFFSSFCLIDLGNAVSVGYKDYVQYFKEFGIDHSVCLLFDILTKNVHFIEVISEVQNQLTNQH
uniref:Uncharacterized protein n=1 Tax=Theileria annulata TaxID=5874 RepID=A0A3B0NCL7_THEAN